MLTGVRDTRRQHAQRTVCSCCPRQLFRVLPGLRLESKSTRSMDQRWVAFDSLALVGRRRRVTLRLKATMQQLEFQVLR